jgi:hypothetical protein
MKYPFTALLTAFLLFAVVSNLFASNFINAGFFAFLLGLVLINLRWEIRDNKDFVELIK